MTPTTALNMIDNVCSKVSMDRQSHSALVDAILLLREVVNKHESQLHGGLSGREASRERIVHKVEGHEVPVHG